MSATARRPSTRQRRFHEHGAAQGPRAGVRGSRAARGSAMTRRLGYKWNLRQVMAGRGMFATTDLIDPLAQRKIRLSSSQVYRLVAERPERLSLKVLMALLDILDCTIDDLIEPAAEPGTEASRKKKAAGAEAGVGELRPRRARI